MNSQPLDSNFFFTEEECQQIFRELEADLHAEGLPSLPTGHDFTSFNFNSVPYHLDPALRRHSDISLHDAFTYGSIPDTVLSSENPSEWMSMGSFHNGSISTSMTADDTYRYDPVTWDQLAQHAAMSTEPLPQLPFDKATAMERMVNTPFDLATATPKEPQSVAKSRPSRPRMNSMRRHTEPTVQAQPPSSSETVETPAATPSNQGVRQQRNHYVIERRYRTNLNEKLRELDEVVPEVVPDINSEPTAEISKGSPDSSSSGPGSANLTQGSSAASSTYSSLKMSPTMTAAPTGKRSARKSHVLDRTLWYIRYLENRIQHSDDKLHGMKKSISLSLDVLMRGGQTQGLGPILDRELLQKTLNDIPEHESETREVIQESDCHEDSMPQ